MVQHGIRLEKMLQFGKNLDYYTFEILPYFGLFLSVYISMFMGTEYSDGTIRNKLIVGHDRRTIYFANLLTCFVGSMVIYLVCAIGSLTGIPYFGLWSIGIVGYIKLMILTLLCTLALTSIFVLMSHLITNKAISAVLNIIVALAIMLTASFIYNALCESETTYSNIIISADEGVVFGDVIANPNYVSGTARTVCKVILNILPTGQQIWIANETVTHPIFMGICSLALILILVFIGQLLFKRKNLK
jgi:ABC-type transport system involved in multi-copper enzyme maturation permease subunit